MKKLRLALFISMLVFGSVMSGLLLVGAQDPATATVFLLDIDGTVNPALADYLIEGINKAEKAGASAVVIRMDTPGGMVTSVKTIIKTMENSKLPIIVYVAPSGSSAASAGAIITVAADVAAMAPGTNIGAAHPVGGGGQQIDSVMSDKIINDLTAYIRGIVVNKGRNADWIEKAIRESVSITSKEALDLKVIDVLADSVPDLLTKVDGRKIQKNNAEVILKTANAKIEKVAMGWRFKILDMIANPNIAYVLMMVGMIGIMMELYNPGVVFPGVIGGISFLLALFALQVLPVNYVGVMLIILSIILFVAELKISSYGLLSIGAIISLTLGSIMLFDTDEAAMRVSWTVIIPTVAMVSSFFIFALGLAVKAWMRKPMTGVQGLIGEVGTALTDLEQTGKVAVRGEYWNARADGRIPKGERVRVLRVENMLLFVTRDTAP